MDPQQLVKYKFLADTVINRLKQVDYKRYLQIVAFSDPMVADHMAASLPALTPLGTQIKDLCDRGLITLHMDRDGVVRAQPCEKTRPQACTG